MSGPRHSLCRRDAWRRAGQLVLCCAVLLCCIVLCCAMFSKGMSVVCCDAV